MPKKKIFEEQVSRKPDNYPWANDFIKSMWGNFWSPYDFNFTADIQQFKTDLSDEERTVVVNALSAIGQIEIAVKTYWARLGDTLKHPSLKDLGLVMGHVEVIHNQAYERLLSVLNLEDVFAENLKLDFINGRVKYLRKYLDKVYAADDKKQFVYSLVLFTLFVENVSLFSQFYIVLWFNRYRNVLFDTAQQVQYTKNEETIHALVGIKIINTIREEYPELFDAELEERIAHEAKEAFKAESKIVEWMLGNFKGENLDVPTLKEYLKVRINDSMKAIGYKEIFEIDTGIADKTVWMNEETTGKTKTDFFHMRPVEYAKHHVDYTEDELFNFEIDFSNK